MDSPRSIRNTRQRIEYEIDENESIACEHQARSQSPTKGSVSVAATSMVPAVDGDNGAAEIRGVGSELWRGTEVHMSGERTVASRRAERQANEIFGKSKNSPLDDSVTPGERARSPTLSPNEASMRPAHFLAGHVPAPMHIAVDRPAHFLAGGDGCHQHKLMSANVPADGDGCHQSNSPAHFLAGGDGCRQQKSMSANVPADGDECHQSKSMNYPLEDPVGSQLPIDDDGDPQSQERPPVPLEPLPPPAKRTAPAPDCANPYASAGP